MNVIILVLCIVIWFWNAIVPCRCILSEIPNCAFEDTVNLTSSKKFSNGSYLYEGVLVPPALTGHYDYVELYEGERQQVTKHIRGCVCHLKQCVKFCCHPMAELYRIENTTSIDCDSAPSKDFNYLPYVNITMPDSSQVLTNVLDEFLLQQGLPCNQGYMLVPHVNEKHKWKLFKNGTLLRTLYQTFLSRRDYCLFAYEVNGRYELHPLNCFTDRKEPPTLMTNTIVMLISAPFLFATILVYWCLPELRNTHSKCFMCYLFSLAIGTTMIVAVNLRTSDYENVTCEIIGYVAYFFFIAAFFWLNVICYDIWRKTSNVQNLMSQKMSYLYLLYGWGVPSLMTTATIALQRSNLPDELKSGIGESHCWLKDDDWSAMIYFYGPGLLLIIFNIVIFYLTVRKIYSVRKDLQELTSGGESAQNLRSQKNSAWLFFRLSIIMGVSWILEIIGYLVGNRTNIILAMADIFNASQGLIIFLLFVVKKNVIVLIKTRILCYLHKKIQWLKMKFDKPDNSME
ncbi:G-protein coupled receptor Mth2-like [Anastrepha ludens]|uniref:G-protein coupled receptor Mth2-like n=1 Tax=Anastrepha ludens TaxID=28586 RepID=UPI0023AEF36B|nr:G-protein coupled receptor Mth2-like [Anastrepha ludens]XP_053955623.1 G-protein coupled receptor Mth2-like [Anastrepha ludens]